MNANSTLVLVTDWAYPNSVSTKWLTTVWNGGIVSAPSYTNNAGTDIKHRIEIQNMGSLTAQKIMNASTFNAGSNRLSGVADTAGNVTIDIQCKWTSNVSAGTESIILLGYSLVHQPGV